ncbi:hypothetical protein ACFLTE_06320 [Bacteroidota bacterium]
MRRNSNERNWKEEYAKSKTFAKVSVSRQRSNSLTQNACIIQSEVSCATAVNTAYSSLPGASSLTVKLNIVNS